MHMYTAGIRACYRIANMFLDCDHVSGIRTYFWNTNIMRITQASSGKATPWIVKDAPICMFVLWEHVRIAESCSYSGNNMFRIFMFPFCSTEWNYLGFEIWKMWND